MNGDVSRIGSLCAIAVFAVLVSACSSPGPSPAVEESASGGARPAAHPCLRPGADSGTRDRTIAYDSELATGSEPGTVVGQVFDVDGDPVGSVLVGLEASASTS